MNINNLNNTNIHISDKPKMNDSDPLEKDSEPREMDNKVQDRSRLIFKMTQGAVKKVWFPGTKIQNRFELDESKKSAYYTPVFSFLGSNKKELKEEVQTMKHIEKVVKDLGEGADVKNLAVHAKETKIEGEYAVRVHRASGGDFEHKIRNATTTLTARLKFGLDCLSGFTNLHKANYVYGDPKPENCLIYDNVLKVADFGKAKQVKGNEALPYKGNTRFAPPEGTLSKMGDVYGVALMLIRNFEEEILKNEKDNTKTSLLSVKRNDFDSPASSKLRGVERFVVEHKAFLASNPGFSLSSLWKRKKMGKRTEVEMKAQETAIHEYISVLELKLQNTDLREKAKDICDLLKQMTLANIDGSSKENPSRMSMEEALEKYKEIQKVIQERSKPE